MKKFIFVLLMLFVGGFIGGCGGSSNSPINNTTASNIWTSSTGTATIKAASDDLEILTSRFGALSSDVIAKVGYEKPKDTTASVTRAVVYIDTEKKLLTGVIFITNSEDSVFKPIVYNNVSITQQGDDWVTPDGTRISGSTSGNSSSSTITGNNSELSFSSPILRKTHDTALKLEDILPGTWTLDGTICGGSSGDLIMLPEKITMHFDSDLNADIFYSIMNNQTAMFQDAFSTKGTLTKLDSDVYKYTETDGTESLIFVENIDEIFMFRLNMLLPLKKTSFTPAKSWTAVSGGGYMKFNTATTNDPLLNLVDTVSFTLKSGTLTVADDNSGSNNTAVSFVYMFDVHNALLEAYGFKEVDNTDTTPMTFTPSGNFLKHTEGSEVYNLVFISEKEAFLGMTTNDENGEGKFVARFEAAE